MLASTVVDARISFADVQLLEAYAFCRSFVLIRIERQNV
jgi:hypothetical protein